MLEISEVLHLAEMFQVLMKMNVQWDTQPTQALAPNFSCPPPQVNINLSHLQSEFDRFMQVMQQWSAEGPHQYSPAPINYNQDIFNITAGTHIPHSTPNMSPVQHSRTSRPFNELEQQRYGYHDRRFQYNCHQEPDQRRYSYISQALPNYTNNDTTSIMLNALENISAKISIQPLTQAVLGSIQRFDGKNKATTISSLIKLS